MANSPLILISTGRNIFSEEMFVSMLEGKEAAGILVIMQSVEEIPLNIL